ncbi:unnamed protein product [Peniophora sp. CBMAI 1063]|nr:unnamed protein product [Peniophora sp. CBMAI 1063]
MVNWREAATERAELAGMEAMSLVLIGIYLHEMACSLKFDLRLMATARDGSSDSVLAKCVKATYLGCRHSVLIAAILELYMVFRSGRGAIPCYGIMKVSAGTAALSSTCCSALIAARTMVVWNWDARITTLVSAVCLAALVTDIRVVVMLFSSYDTVSCFCTLTDESANLPNILALLVCDFVLLVCLLAGLYRWHHPTKGSRGFSLWSVLWMQGVLYLIIASVTEVPALVFLFLNLNTAMDIIFTRPLIVLLVLAATRFHRSLHAFTPNKPRHEFTDTIHFATVDVGASRSQTC